MSGPNDEAGKPTKIGVTTIQPLASGSPTNAPNTGAPRRPNRRGNGPTSNRAGGSRGVARNRSGPMMQSRGLPIRGVARNRSGPMVRTVSRNKSGPRRGVNRTTSKTRALPLKTNSFHRSGPERASSSSSSSLRKKFRRQNAAAPGQVVVGAPCIRETRYTESSGPSNQTKNGNNKSQVSHIPAELRTRQIKVDDLSVATSDLDTSLHTMDSMMFHKKHVDEGGFTDDMSAFEESFISTATYMDDYGDDFSGDEPATEDSSTRKIDIEMQDMQIDGGKKSANDGADEEFDDDLEEELK